MILSYIAQGMKRDTALQISGISKHQYYHQPKTGRKGRKCSTHTKKVDGSYQDNHLVIDYIKEVQKDPDIDCGYHKMTYELRHLGYIINHKKVYRLMQKASLLKEKNKTTNKEYVKYRIVTPKQPLEVLEMDIKMIWVQEDRRHAYVLTIIDTFTRMALHWTMGYRMTALQVEKAWEHVILEHLQPNDMLKKDIHVELRNDNGPQFSAKKLRSFLKDNHVNQVFTHPYTPQENGHVESFHSIIKKALNKEEFWSFKHLEERLIIFYEKYNNRRIHASLAYLSPRSFWEYWDKKQIERIELKNKKVKFKLLVPRHLISGNKNLKEVPCSNLIPFNREENLETEEMYGPKTLCC